MVRDRDLDEAERAGAVVAPKARDPHPRVAGPRRCRTSRRASTAGSSSRSASARRRGAEPDRPESLWPRLRFPRRSDRPVQSTARKLAPRSPDVCARSGTRPGIPRSLEMIFSQSPAPAGRPRSVRGADLEPRELHRRQPERECPDHDREHEPGRRSSVPAPAIPSTYWRMLRTWTPSNRPARHALPEERVDQPDDQRPAGQHLRARKTAA